MRTSENRWETIKNHLKRQFITFEEFDYLIEVELIAV